MTSPEPEYIQVRLRYGIKFLIDVDDYFPIRRLPFYGNLAENDKWYVMVGVPAKNESGCRYNKRVHLACLLTGLEPGDPLVADHINGNPLDNRRINLRVCTHQQNMLNRRMNRNNTTGFKGVTQVGPNRWAAAIAMNGCCHYLGVYDSPEKAHAVYCEAAVWLHGEFANFGEERSEDFRLAPALRPDAMPVQLAIAGSRQRQRAHALRTGFIIRPRAECATL